MKTLNLYKIDKQNSLLDNQTNMISAYDFIHNNNISNISREFANQSAHLALSKYLQEKDNIEKIKNSNDNNLVDNSPSINKLK